MSKNEQLKDAIDSIKYRHKMKQSEIAERLGVRNTYLSDMINGRVAFSANTKTQLSELFSYTFNDEINEVCLLTGEGEMLKKSIEVNSNMVSMPADVWAVISNQAESLKVKDKQTSEAMKQTSEVIDLLKEQLKKGRDATDSRRAVSWMEEEGD